MNGQNANSKLTSTRGEDEQTLKNNKKKNQEKMCVCECVQQ